MNTKLKLSSKWPFGKYKDTPFTIGDVARKDPMYVIHAVKNPGGYTFSDNVEETAKQYLLPSDFS